MMDKQHRRSLASQYWKYLVSAILISLSGCLGVLVDSIIVGTLIGEDGVSAISLNSPLVQLMFTLSLLIASGGGMLVGYSLGKGDYGRAKVIFTLTFLASLAIGMAFAIAGLLFPHSIAGFLCSNGNLLGLVREYLTPTLLGAPAYMIMWWLSTMASTDGSPKLVSAAIFIDNLLNLLLDVVLIKFCGLGITGSALATVIGHIAGIAIMLFHFRGTGYRTGFASCKGSSGKWKEIISQGAPLAVASVCLTLLLLTSNRVVLESAGRTGIFVFAVCMNLLQIYNLFLAGTCRSLQTFGAVIKGKGNKEEFAFIIGKAVLFITVAMALICAYVWLFPQTIATMFGTDDTEMISLSCHALRIFCLSFVPFCYIYLIMIIYKLMGYGTISLFISFILSLTVIPVLVVVARWFPQWIWYSYLIAYIIEIAMIAIFHKAQGINLREELGK